VPQVREGNLGLFALLWTMAWVSAGLEDCGETQAILSELSFGFTPQISVGPSRDFHLYLLMPIQHWRTGLLSSVRRKRLAA
jgi:hypothetical protein